MPRSNKELQESLGWLIKNGLINKEGKKYLLTESGKAIRNTNCKTMMKSWDAVAKEFGKLSSAESADDSISLEETKTAYKVYNKRFWKMYRELKEKDKTENK